MRRILRDLFDRDGIDPATLDYVSSPLGRARQTMELAAAGSRLAGRRLSDRSALTEISFGDWEGFTIAQLRERDPERIAAREHDKWQFVPPGGESYKTVAERMRGWYDGLTRDAVVTAHGGTARGLMAMLGIAKPAAAPLVDIAQGVVYVFENDRLSRYA